jgi:hypothetical protein
MKLAVLIIAPVLKLEVGPNTGIEAVAEKTVIVALACVTSLIRQLPSYFPSQNGSF